MVYEVTFLNLHRTLCIILLSICISNAQDFAFLGFEPGDTTIQQFNNSVNTITNTKNSSIKKDIAPKPQFHSLAFKNNSPLSDQNFSFNKNFEPAQLKYQIEDNNSLNYDDQYQMIDGTYWRGESEINNVRLFSVLGSMLTLDLIAYNYQRRVWDQENTTSFHSIDWWIDVHNFQRMDKLGHFTDAYFVSDLTSKLYRWSGVSGESSVWFGALTGWIWLLEIEISDGFFADWGFSWLDLSANTLGAGFFVLQNYFPEVLGGLHPKFSYHVSQAWKDGIYTKNPKAFIDDYEGMTFWMGINFHHYFPDSWKKDYPEWLAPLGIAIGYGAEGIAPSPQYGKPQWYVGLDIDLREIPFGDESGIFRFIKSEVNFLRLPLPTVRITPGGIWYGLYF